VNGAGNGPSPSPQDSDAGARFRKTLVRVMTVQVVSLVLLWLLQRHYTV
jgi:hypothetical protein